MVLSCHSLTKHYTQGTNSLSVFSDISLDLAPQRITALVGSSGSGKSTLLHCLGLLEMPSAGRVTLLDTAMDSAAVCLAYRRKHIGFIYQFHHLLHEFTATENVMMPLILNGINKSDALKESAIMLQRLGLSHRLTHKPAQLSGGEQQRVAIARAFVHYPALILADEPTGNLDNETADSVFDALMTLMEDYKMTALIATHDRALAAKCHTTLRLHQGCLQNI